MDNPARPDPSQELPAPPEEKLLRAPTFGEKYSKYRWAILSLIVIVVSCSIYIVANNTQTPSETLPVPTPSQPSPTSFPNPMADPTINWKIFTNTKYGYSINYPRDWALAGSGPGQTSEFISQHFWVTMNGCLETTKSCGHITIRVTEINEADSALSAKEIWLNALTKNMRPAIDKVENVEFNGIAAIKVSYVNNFIDGQTSESTVPIPMKTVVFLHMKRLYTIDIREFYVPPKDTALSEWKNNFLYDQILSTFKFTQ